MEASLDAALAQLDREISDQMAAHDTPGLSLVITDRAKTVAVRCYGKRDLGANLDVTPDTVFEIGSVGKSFTAIALLQLQERGLVDLSAPVTDYLPWFTVRSDYQPITITHLLSHTGGIIGGSDMSYDGRFESWYLRETEVSGPPGERFHYSNVGYKTLGYLIEAITERAYGDVVRERILTPLGMDATVVPITNADRPKMAVGYRPLHDDRPRPKGAPLVPATWIETATADGCLASTPEDMARYLRMLLARGQGPSGPIMSEESYVAMTTPIASRAFALRNVSYGLGMSLLDVDGRQILGHGGGMIGYYCSLAYDPEAGLGAFAIVNGPGDPTGIALRALKLVRAGLEGEDVEPLEMPVDPYVVPDAAGYVGNYYGLDFDVSLIADEDGLFAEIAGERRKLQRYGENEFLIDDSRYGLFPIAPVRDDDGNLIALRHGPDWFARADADQPPVVEYPPLWESLPGHYRCHNPWHSNLRIVLRRGHLVLIHPTGGEEALSPLEDGTFRVGEEQSPERVRFDAVVDGKAQRLNLSGQDFYRSPLS